MVADPRRLFCSGRCNQIAQFVRYARRKVAQGAYDRPDIAETIALRRDILVEGLCDERARSVTNKVRNMLASRTNGRCENRSRALTTEGDARSGMDAAATAHLDFFTALDLRIRAEKPVLLCDDPDSWPVVYRRLLAEARQSRPS